MALLYVDLHSKSLVQKLEGRGSGVVKKLKRIENAKLQQVLSGDQ